MNRDGKLGSWYDYCNAILFGVPSKIHLIPLYCSVDLTVLVIFTLKKDLLQFAQFTHEMEDGWGLATDDKILFGSDGTSTLYQINPHTFKGPTHEILLDFNTRTCLHLILLLHYWP